MTDDLGGFAATYIRRKRTVPFFMYLGFNAPHTPMHATEADLALFESVEDPAVRRGPWKLIRVETNELVLVNLDDDPGELENVASRHPDRVERMLRELASWEAGMVAPLWAEGERWERNQIRKHQADVIGREMERIIP